MLEALLNTGDNHLEKEFAYLDSVQSRFPLDFTTTTMMTFMPSIVDSFAYDLPLTTKVSTMGAPRLIIDKSNENKVSFDMRVDFILEDRTEKIFAIDFKNITIDFSLNLEDMWITADWKAI